MIVSIHYPTAEADGLIICSNSSRIFNYIFTTQTINPILANAKKTIDSLSNEHRALSIHTWRSGWAKTANC